MTVPGSGGDDRVNGRQSDELSATNQPEFSPGWIWAQLKGRVSLVHDMVAVYGIHFANQALPLITVPYLSRVLGPAEWGLVAMAQSFALYGNLVVDYGFAYSATREIAQSTTKTEVEKIIAGVSGAKIILGVLALLAAWLAYWVVPLFHRHPVLLWTATISEVIKAFLPVYYFYGIKRVSLASMLDISARIVAATGIFLFVHRPEDAWKIFALTGVTSMVIFLVGHGMMFTRHTPGWPRIRGGIKMLREGWAMFLFRSAHSIYSLGNAFILGLFAAPQVVGYYAGAEKINTAAVGLLAPFTVVLYPRAATLAKDSLSKAARVTTISMYIIGALSIGLTLIMWFGAGLIIPIILGHGFAQSEGVLKILSVRTPMIAWTNVLGFQWLLVLGLERQFQKITLAALMLNTLLATVLAPRFSYDGMAWAVVTSQLVAALGIYMVLQRRGLNPFRMRSDEAYA